MPNSFMLNSISKAPMQLICLYKYLPIAKQHQIILQPQHTIEVLINTLHRSQCFPQNVNNLHKLCPKDSPRVTKHPKAWSKKIKYVDVQDISTIAKLSS